MALRIHRARNTVRVVASRCLIDYIVLSTCLLFSIIVTGYDRHMTNRREIAGKGQSYVVTRRLLPGGKGLRVRVTAYKSSLALKGDEAYTSFKDYVSVAEGDWKFAKLISQLEEHCL